MIEYDQSINLPEGNELDTLVEIEALKIAGKTEYGIRWLGEASKGPLPATTWNNIDKETAERKIAQYQAAGMDCRLILRRQTYFDYSQTWEGMEAIVEAMTERGYRLILTQRDNQFIWDAAFRHRSDTEPKPGGSSGTSAPHAVALAALGTLRSLSERKS